MHDHAGRPAAGVAVTFPADGRRRPAARELARRVARAAAELTRRINGAVSRNVWDPGQLPRRGLGRRARGCAMAAWTTRRSSSAPDRSPRPTSSGSPATAPASGWPTRRSPRSPPAATSSTGWPATTGRTTASPPASARWPPGTSRSTRRAQLQRSLIRSHAAGSGPEVEREVVRALMLLRLSTLATGRTGVRPETARAYAALLDAGLTPVVHEYGSLGCSGDLAPLSSVALALMGEGTCATPPASCARPPRRCAPPASSRSQLAEKEGLALVNGTDGMLGMLLLALADLRRLLTTADVAAAMSVEALLGTDAVFAADLQALRPHPGQAASAANLRALLAGSGVMASHRGPECTRVQDAYSLRCAPQVHGAARDTARARRHRRRPGARRRDRQPGGHRRTAGSSPTATSTAPRSATCSTSSPSPSPTSRA